MGVCIIIVLIIIVLLEPKAWIIAFIVVLLLPTEEEVESKCLRKYSEHQKEFLAGRRKALKKRRSNSRYSRNKK